MNSDSILSLWKSKHASSRRMTPSNDRESLHAQTTVPSLQTARCISPAIGGRGAGRNGVGEEKDARKDEGMGIARSRRGGSPWPSSVLTAGSWQHTRQRGVTGKFPSSTGSNICPYKPTLQEQNAPPKAREGRVYVCACVCDRDLALMHECVCYREGVGGCREIVHDDWLM